MRACVSELFNITYPRLTYPRCFGFFVFLFVFFLLFNFFLSLITVLDEGKNTTVISMVGTNTAADRVIFAFFLANTAELILVVFPFIGPF